MYFIDMPSFMRDYKYRDIYTYTLCLINGKCCALAVAVMVNVFTTEP